MVHLDGLIQFYHHRALAPSSFSTYNTGLRSYSLFCTQTGLPRFPLTEINLQRYVVSLANRLGYKSIKVYLAGIQFFSIMYGYDVTLSNFPRLFYLLRGIRRVQGSQFSRPRRLPITFQQLLLIHRRLGVQRYSSFHQLLLRTMSSLAFFGLLRCSEYTSSSRSSYDALTTLLVQDVSFNIDFLLMMITIKSSKTDPFRTGCTIRVAAVNTPVCPVSLMREYLRCHPTGFGPLFVWRTGQFLIRHDVVLMLRRCFPGVHNINTHSFRIGGASAAASAGIPDSQIQILGRWSSDAYRRYLHLGEDSVRALGQALTGEHPYTRVWDPTLGASVLFR